MPLSCFPRKTTGAGSPSILRREDELDREIGILTAIAKQEGKPEAIIERIIARDTSITVGKFLQDAAMEVLGFDRMAVKG